MRVLMVHDEALEGGYGAEAYVRRLVTGLRDAGDEVDVVAGEIRHRGVTKLLDLWDPAARRLVGERAQALNADVVHFHNIGRELSSSVITAAAGVPAVMTVHDLRMFGGVEHRFGPKAAGERLAVAIQRDSARRHLAATIGVSERVTDVLRRRSFPRACTVPVPVAMPQELPSPAEQCSDVAVIARLAPDKGVDIAIDAFAQATHGDLRPCRLLVAGDGPQWPQLERRAKRSGADVEFLGRLDEPEVAELLGSVRVVMVCSQPGRRPEGSSLSAVEAAAYGRPVVTSADTALREVAESLGHATVVEGRDAGRYAEALRTLLDDDALVASLGAHGRANAERWHSVAAVMAATRAVYREVTGSRNR